MSKSDRGQRTLHNLSVVQTETNFRVHATGAGKRVDKLIRNRLPWLNQRILKKWAAEERILRNGLPIPPGRKLREGDVITILHTQPWEDVSDMDRIHWGTIHEDERILVLNKPPHLVVHPAGGYRYTTLLNALHRKYLGDKTDLTEDDPVPRLVHRIDKDTSGVLVVAFDREAHGKLGKLFEARADEVEKEYVALVEGRVEWTEKDIELPIGELPDDPIRIRRAVREDGQPARTLVRRVRHLGHYSLVRCRIFTGRQHQIRVHMQAVGHPLVGDHLYGVRDELREADVADPSTPFRYENIYLDDSVDNVVAADRIRQVDLVRRREYWEIEGGRKVKRGDAGRLLISRCALHCAMMAFPHPATGKPVRFEAPLTADLELAIKYLRGSP